MANKEQTDYINGRCAWCGTDALYTAYHDYEWGRLQTDDCRLFEFIVLESAQAGLSWITILRKRAAYREAFYDFCVNRVAAMTNDDVERLLKNSGIVKNRRKIEATISNARHFITIQREFGSFDAYLRSFLPNGNPIDHCPHRLVDIPTTSPLSDTISADMRKRGFKFFGSTICYSFLQATGYINDHLANCICRQQTIDVRQEYNNK